MAEVVTLMWDGLPHTVQDLCARCGLGEDAVRQCLLDLYDRGVVRKDGKEPTARKPRQLWVLQPLGELFREPDR